MRKLMTIMFIISFIVFFGKHILAATYYVPDDFPTIQSAIDGVSNGDTILARAGTYNENINIDNKSITLQSTDGPSATIIDGGGITNTVYIFNSDSVTIDGFTIRNGQAFDGAGAHIEANGSGLSVNITMLDNIISQNYAEWGGGIAGAATNSALVTLNLINNDIQNNRAYHSGGGIALNAETSGSVTVVSNNNNISNNSADNLGGGVYLNPVDFGAIVDFTSNNDTINNNSADSGGGISAYSVASALNLTIDNSTINNNSGGLYIYPQNSTVNITVSNSNISENAGGEGGGFLIYDVGSNPTINLIGNNISSNERNGNGGGIYFYSRSSTASLNLSMNTISDNYIWGNAGNGIYITNGVNSNLTIILEKNRILNNYTFVANSNGGGMCLANAGFISLQMLNNIIAKNNTIGLMGGSDSYGGGVYLSNSGSIIIDSFNNTITTNTTVDGGGGIYVTSSSGSSDLFLKNDIIWGNIAAQGTDIYNYMSTASISISYSDIGEIFGSYIDEGNNISIDPLFNDSNNGDYHLTVSSPCIDSGTSDGAPDTDIEGNARPQGSGYDMGAYEYVVNGTVPTPDIKANGLDGLVILNQGDSLIVTVSLDPGSHGGENADWWAAATSPFGLYWFTLDSGWIRSDAPICVYGGPLFDLSPFTILEMSTLPVGNYTFYFAVDDNMDGVLDATYLDSVPVTVQ